MAWVPDKLAAYYGRDPHVELQVMPGRMPRMRWAEWEDAVGEMIHFYERFEAVQLLYSVFDNLGRMLANGTVHEVDFSV